MTDHSTRIERDTFGPIEVPADRLWGAQTKRSLASDCAAWISGQILSVDGGRS